MLPRGRRARHLGGAPRGGLDVATCDTANRVVVVDATDGTSLVRTRRVVGADTDGARDAALPIEACGAGPAAHVLDAGEDCPSHADPGQADADADRGPDVSTAGTHLQPSPTRDCSAPGAPRGP